MLLKNAPQKHYHGQRMFQNCKIWIDAMYYVIEYNGIGASKFFIDLIIKTNHHFLDNFKYYEIWRILFIVFYL